MFSSLWQWRTKMDLSCSFKLPVDSADFFLLAADRGYNHVYISKALSTTTTDDGWHTCIGPWSIITGRSGCDFSTTASIPCAWDSSTNWSPLTPNADVCHKKTWHEWPQQKADFEIFALASLQTKCTVYIPEASIVSEGATCSLSINWDEPAK